MELLTRSKDTSMANVSLRTDIPNLSIIPAGQPVAGATEIWRAKP